MISIQKAVRTCKVAPSEAHRIQSDRILDSNIMVCPTWNGHDTAGRPICADSFGTKTPGCHNASDRVIVENHLRPQYIEYINLDASGIQGKSCPTSHKVNQNIVCQQKDVKESIGKTGSSGMVTPSQHIIGSCTSCKEPQHVESYRRTHHRRR